MCENILFCFSMEKKQRKPKGEFVSIKLVGEVREKLLALAAKERRSLATMTTLLVERGIESTEALRVP